MITTHSVEIERGKSVGTVLSGSITCLKCSRNHFPGTTLYAKVNGEYIEYKCRKCNCSLYVKFSSVVEKHND